jgi:hypothetical protein
MESDVLRTEECLTKYRAKRKEYGEDLDQFELTDLPHVREYTRWVLVENEFPYDRIADRHCLLVPKRRFVDDGEMLGAERAELLEIKQGYSDSKEFDCVFENLKHNRTVPGHYHLHVLKFKYRTPLSDL